MVVEVAVPEVDVAVPDVLVAVFEVAVDEAVLVVSDSVVYDSVVDVTGALVVGVVVGVTVTVVVVSVVGTSVVVVETGAVQFGPSPPSEGHSVVANDVHAPVPLTASLSHPHSDTKHEPSFATARHLTALSRWYRQSFEHVIALHGSGAAYT